MGIVLIAVIITSIIYWMNECKISWDLCDHKIIKRFFYAMRGEWLTYLFCITIAFFLSLILNLGVSMLVTKYANNNKYILKSTEPLYAIEDNFHSYVWRHSSDDKDNFTFIIKEDLGFAARTVNAKISHIQYTTDTPKMEEYFATFKNPILNFLFVNTDFFHYIFYVPEGSVTSSYNIDLKSGG